MDLVRQEKFDECTNKITPYSLDLATDTPTYITAMENIVNGQYQCLRSLYDVNPFNVEQGGYCGPGTASVDPDSEHEELLGLRCAETLCCGNAMPNVEDGPAVEEETGQVLYSYGIQTCQSADKVMF
jgi:hypothetical protein